jgi:predicted glutamine amidotransferase
VTGVQTCALPIYQDKIPDKFKNDTDYYHLKYTKKDGQVVVASSGWNQDGWEEIPNGSVLVVERVGQKSQLFKV